MAITRKQAIEDIPKFVSIKRIVTLEDYYNILSSRIKTSELKDGLVSGDLNLQQSETVESYVFVIDGNGTRVVHLEKTGASGPDHEVEIVVEPNLKLK